MRRRGDATVAEARLTTPDLRDAETLLLRDIQRRHYQKEAAALAAPPSKPDKLPSVQPGSTITSLNAFKDDAGLLRCRGRLEKATYLSYDSRHPIILPHNDDDVLELVRQLHEHVLQRVGEHLPGHHVVVEVMCKCACVCECV